MRSGSTVTPWRVGHGLLDQGREGTHQGDGGGAGRPETGAGGDFAGDEEINATPDAEMM